MECWLIDGLATKNDYEANQIVSSREESEKERILIAAGEMKLFLRINSSWSKKLNEWEIAATKEMVGGTRVADKGELDCDSNC
jgi:hypothetical protein